MENMLLSIPDACRILGIKRSLMYRMMKNGDITFRKIGRRTLIPMSSVKKIAEG
ncbi:MAG: helix-turn-helix domain-containing protein [Sphingobium sp.]|nr:helix-turn-helix domain-containing protein [Sphingobium sp.]MCP5398978.1 helix-turn-helix domain-containing protein [Sphingomonas sp.]